MKKPLSTLIDAMREETGAYFKTSLNDFYGIPANRIMIYAVVFILAGLSVFAALSVYDHINLLISIPLKFMGINAWHTAANFALCAIVADVLFAYIVRPWGAYGSRTIGKVWIIFFVGFLLAFISERTVAYKLIGLYEPVVIFLWEASPTERAGALPMFFFTLPFWFFITIIVVGIITRKQTQIEAYVSRQIDRILRERKGMEKNKPDRDARSPDAAMVSSGKPLALQTEPGVGPIHPSDIGHVTAEDHYLRIYYEKEANLLNTLVRMTLKELFAMLPEANFIQIHRSHLVNLEKLSGFKRQGQAAKLTMVYGDFELPVSRYRLPNLLPVLKKYFDC